MPCHLVTFLSAALLTVSLSVIILEAGHQKLALQDSLNNISTQTASSELLITDLSVTETIRQLKKFEVMNIMLSDIQKARYLLDSGLLQLI